MNLMNKASWLSAAGLGVLLVTGAALPVAGQSSGQYGRERRIEGQRFTTMRALAHRLDEAAATAARGASDTEEERSGRMRQRFLWAVDDFARQASSLHERLERYGDSPWDVADEIQALNQRANQVNRQLRGARAFSETHQDWAEVVTTLGLMNRSLRGQNVSLPADRDYRYTPFDERTRFRNGRHYEADRPGYGRDRDRDRDGELTGTSLRDFRRQANTLNVESIRLLSVAERRGRSNDQGERAYADLRRFAQQAADLSRRRGDALDSRETSAIVARMMAEARDNERSVRDSGAQPRVEWAASILILEQMTNALPRP